LLLQIKQQLQFQIAIKRIKSMEVQTMDVKKMCEGGIPPMGQMKEKISGMGADIVIAAAYGTLDQGKDVTPAVQDIVRKGIMEITVSNETLGGDPVPGIQKRFGIVYRMGGALCARAALEGETIKLGK
jgi:hypothetical protein